MMVSLIRDGKVKTDGGDNFYLFRNQEFPYLIQPKTIHKWLSLVHF